MARDLGYWSGTFAGIASGLAMCSLLACHAIDAASDICIYVRLAWLHKGILGQSKSLSDDGDMVVADGYLESDRELIALEDYMRDARNARDRAG